MLGQILNRVGHFSAQDVERFAQRIRHRDVAKDEVLLAQGQVCQTIFFNLEGALYQFNYNDEMDLKVIDLHLEQEWVINDRSFIAQKPSDVCIKAYTDCKVFELTLQELHQLIAESPAFLQLGKIMEYATARVHFFDTPLSPAEKYLHILEHRPALIQQFPLKIIASYLKITPETLSRVREKLAKGSS